ncbi:MAG: carbohydrate kinase family protein [Clostridiales bacterium]|nr:carbohydrate kinase family protein [Clostridiales bacterium]
MRQGIAAAGNLIVDSIKTTDCYPEEGYLSTILSLGKSGGGAPTNVSIDLSKMDSSLPIQVIGVVGSDEDGDYVIDLLKGNGIDTRGIKRDPTTATSFTDVINVESTGHRTFFHYRGANSLLDVEHFEFEKIDAKILHLGYALLLDTLDSEDKEYGTRMARVLAMAQKHGIKTSLDAVSESSDRFSSIVPHSLKHCNYFIVNEFEASLTTGIPDRDGAGMLIVENMRAMCSKLLEMGVNDLAVIHAPEGGFAMEADGSYYVQPSLELPDGYIKGTVGAGDAFCSGVLYSLYNEWNTQRALEIAVSSAAQCLSHVNATDGMADISVIKELYEKMEKQKLPLHR